MRHFYSCLLLFAILLTAGSARATHIYGADFFYEFVTGNTYKISLVIYGDCSGMSFPALQNATPTVTVLEGGIQRSTITLSQVGPGVEVTPVCAAEANNTACINPTNPIPGVTRYIYAVNYTVAYSSSSWIFHFAGAMGGSSAAGRSNSITNITIGTGGSLLTLNALLNNTLGPNSSPQFTTLPTPFYCVNVPQQYNQGAVDVNNDSLVYALVPGLDGTSTVVYNPGYTATAPLATATGTFSFSSMTGQMSFTPNTTQKSLIVNQVNEYRNGVLVGTASREMTFVVLSTCNSTPATSSIDSTLPVSAAGGIVANTSTFNVCEGTASIQFSIIAYNLGNDTIIASVNGLPAGAVATITQNNTIAPVVTINWSSVSVPAGNYNFFVTYKDNGCPLSSSQTQAYTIRVIKPNQITTAIVVPTHCIHKALVRYNFAYGLLPRSITISQGGNIINTFTDNTGSALDSLAPGTYTIVIASPKLPCATSYLLQVVDSGIYPFIPQVISPVFYCKNDQPLQLFARPDSGAIVHWYNAQGTLLPAPPTPRTDTTGIFTWYFNQRFKVCESLRDSVQVYVTLRPIAGIAGPSTICQPDTASFSFNGSIGVGPILEYFWDWGDAGYVAGQDEGPWRVHWYSPGTKIIKLRVEENKCTSAEVQKSIIVKPVPYAGFNVRNRVCQYDTLRVTYNTRPAKGQTYAWSFDGANMLASEDPGPFVLSWDTAGVKHLLLSVDLDGCVDTLRADITVHPVPGIRILNIPAPVCIGDKIYLAATGDGTYEWSPQDSLRYTQDGKLYAQILKPSVYRVKATTKYGCVDSAQVAYNVVQPCCNFSYPNAFTPNGDGHNDRFRIVTYGNQREFELSIYNQWGQRVYYGLDPQQGWDGSFNGKPCELGTYFYYLNARCFTDHQETQKGDLLLIR